MKARVNLVWLVGMLLATSLLACWPFERKLQPLPFDTVLGVDGVCLGDSIARVIDVLGPPVRKEGWAILFGKGQDISQVYLLDQYVVAVYGERLTDERGRTLGQAGIPAERLEQLLGEDWIEGAVCGKVPLIHHYEHWHLVVLVDASSHRTEHFGLDERPFPDRSVILEMSETR